MSKREKVAPTRLGCLTRAVGDAKEAEFSPCKIIVFIVEKRKKVAPIRLLLKRGKNSSCKGEAQHAYLGCLTGAEGSTKEEPRLIYPLCKP